MTTRRRFLKGAIAAAGVSLLSSISCGEEDRARRRPNVLLIVADDLPIPVVRHLARTGARVRDPGMDFANTFAVSPVCSPDRASLLTGLYVHNHGVETNADAGEAMISNRLHADSVAVRLKGQGYATGMFGKVVNNHPPGHVPAGWDSFVALVEPTYLEDEFAAAINGKPTRISRNRHNETAWLSEQARAFMRQPRERPWFCYVAPNSPHVPSHAKEDNQRRANKVPFYRSPSRSERDLSDKPAWARNREPAYTPWPRTYRGVVGESLDVDDLVEELVAALADSGELKDTYVIFTSDNGFAFGEHGLDSKNHPYDEATKLPLFVRGPDIKPGAVSQKLVSLVDVTATVVDIAGGRWEDLDGRSLLPLLRGLEQTSWRARLLVENFMQHTWRVVRDERYVYIRDEPTGFEQLYDMEKDPYQEESISSRRDAAEIVERKRSELAALRDARGPGLRSAET